MYNNYNDVIFETDCNQPTSCINPLISEISVPEIQREKFQLFQKYPQLQRYLSHNRLQYHCILLLHVPLARMSLHPHRYCLWICWYKFTLFVRQNAQVLTTALVVTIRSIQPVAILSTGWKETDVLCGVSPAG